MLGTVLHLIRAFFFPPENARQHSRARVSKQLIIVNLRGAPFGSTIKFET